MAGPTNKGIERPKNDPKGKKDRQKKLEERKAAFDKRQFNSEKEKEEEQLALRTEEAAIEAMEVDNSSADSGDASTGDPPIKGEEVQQPLESIPAASTVRNRPDFQGIQTNSWQGGGGTNLNTESNGGAGVGR